MLLTEKLFMWDKGIRFSPETSGVYIFYNKDRQVIYIGGTTNIRETFTEYFENDFSSDPRKRETKYYKRMPSPTWKEKQEDLVREHIQKFGRVPKYNAPLATQNIKEQNKTFHFYEAIDRPLFIKAIDLEDFWKKLKIAPISSIEFHFKRGDFTLWIQEICKDEKLAEKIRTIQSDGEDLRKDLLNLSDPNPIVVVSFECPKCKTLNNPIKTWKMAGRPNKKGEKLELTIGFHKCSNCNASFRKVLKKELIKNPTARC